MYMYIFYEEKMIINFQNDKLNAKTFILEKQKFPIHLCQALNIQTFTNSFSKNDMKIIRRSQLTTYLGVRNHME